jgi:hypothetical protein
MHGQQNVKKRIDIKTANRYIAKQQQQWKFLLETLERRFKFVVKKRDRWV